MSGLIVVLLLAQILLARQNNFEQNRLSQAQQIVTQAQGFQANLKQLAMRIYQLSQQTQDQGLKDLLVRQQITFNSNQSSGNGSSSPSETTPSTTH